MASKGNRVLKQKTLKAKKIDLEAGRSSKYVSKNTPKGDINPKLPSKSEVREAYKGNNITKEERDTYLGEISDYNENKVRKTKTPGAVAMRTGGDTRADKLTTKELKKAARTKKGREVLTRNTVKESLSRPLKGSKPLDVPAPKPGKFENDARIKALATNKLTKRAEEIGLVGGQSSASRKVVEAELGKEAKQYDARARRRSQKEEEEGIVASIQRDRDLKPGQQSTLQKIQKRGKAHKVKRQKDSARVADVPFYDAEAEKEVAKMEKSPGTPKERNVSIDTNAANDRMSPGLRRRFLRKQRYNAMRAAGVKGPKSTARNTKKKLENYQRAAAGAESVKTAENITAENERKSLGQDLRATQVARKEDRRRDRRKKEQIAAINDSGLTGDAKTKAINKAESIIRNPKETIKNKAGETILTHRDTPMVERTIVDPRNQDKKYTRVVPLGAPRLFDRVEEARKGGKRVRIKSGSQKGVIYDSGKPVDKQGRTRSERAADPKIANAGDKAPKFEIIEQNSPEKLTGINMRGGHTEALGKVAKHVWGSEYDEAADPKRAAVLRGHVQAFAKQHANANKSLGNHERLVTSMVESFSKPNQDKRLEAVRGMIKAHGRSREEQSALANEKRTEAYQTIREQEKQSKT